MTEQALSRRDELNNLIAEIQADEAVAMNEAAEIFASDDMTTLTDVLGKLQARTVPKGHFDQILGSVLNVIGSTKSFFGEMQAQQAQQAEMVAAQAPANQVIENPPQAPAEEPASQE